MTHPPERHGRLAKLLAVLAGSSLGVGLLGAVAGASTADPTSNPPQGMAYVEICKSFTAPTVNESTTPTFGFNLTGVPGPVFLQAGSGSFSCTKPMAVTPGTVTISETPGSWYAVSSITEPPGDSFVVPGSVDLGAGSVQVQVAAGQSATVQYTNDPVYGYVEVCKDTQSNSPLTGSFAYDLTGENGFTGTATAAVGSCSPPVAVPAGSVQVVEQGTNLYVTSITAKYDGTGASALQASPPASLQTGTATVWADPATSPASETTVYYEDNVVQFKLCKAFVGGTPPSTAFPFGLSSSGPAGPASLPATLSLAAGTPQAPVCSNPVQLRAGTTVSVTEGLVPGTKVASITAKGALSLVSTTGANPDPLNGTAQVVVGQPTTTSTSPVNEATVTFTDTAADPGALKLCVTSATTDTIAPAGSSYNFSVSGAPGVVTNVPLNGCGFVGGSTSPVMFPFASAQTVTGLNLSPDVATIISAVPTNLTQIVNGAAATTSTPTIVGTPDLTTPKVSVLVSEGGSSLTEVHISVGGATSGKGSSSTGTTGTTGTTSEGTGSTGMGSTGTTGTTGTTNEGTGSTGMGSTGTVPPIVVTNPPASTTSSTSAADPPASANTAAAAKAAAAKKALVLARDRASLKRVSHDITVTRHGIARYRRLAAHAAKMHLGKRHVAFVADAHRLTARLNRLLADHNRLNKAIHRLA